MTDPQEGEEIHEAPEVEAVEEQETPEAQDAPEVEQEPEKPWSDEDEQEAKAFGWKSPDEWKGEVPPGYISDPKEYMERAERFTPFRKLREQVEQANERARKIETALEAGHRRDMERQKREFENRVQYLEGLQRKAADDMDLVTYDQIGRQLRGMRPPQEEAPQQQPQRKHPAEEYGDTHEWLKDPVLFKQGGDIIQAALDSGTRFQSDVEQVEYAEKQLKAYFPHLFKQPEPAQQSKPRVDGGGLAPVAAKRTGYDTLPKDVKSVFERQVSAGIFKNTKEDKEFFFNEYQNG